MSNNVRSADWAWWPLYAEAGPFPGKGGPDGGGGGEMLNAQLQLP